jgi:succinyl-CoA synthetase alpha subunit
MSILIDASTRVIVQGITGAQGRFDVRHCLAYGTRVVAGVTPGRGGETVEGVPVFDTVRAAMDAVEADASAIYVPARGVKNAVLEAVEAGIRVLLATTENVPRHDASLAVAEARAAGARLVGFNSNGLISPGRCKMGGIGGDRPDDIYKPGRIGVCSRSGGMSAEICATLAAAGFGVSTCVALGGDPIVGMRMAECLRLFEEDPETDACVVFGEPGTSHEQGVAEALRRGELTKPVVALIAGRFQEAYPAGVSFGHIAAMIREKGDSASEKQKLLRESGARVAATLEEIPSLLADAGIRAIG